MAPQTVFLLTNVFPFATGEEFLENEIGHLAAGFERVVIVACQPPADAEQTRQVPDNVTVLRAGAPRPGGRRAASMIARTMPAIVRRGPSHAPVNPAKIAAESLFEARAQASMDLLTEHLDGLGLAAGTEAVIYSYWFHVTALTGMLLAEELRRRGLVVTKLVSRAHRYDLYPEESPLHHIPARRMLFEAYDEVHPVSDHGTELLRTTYPRFAPKITTRRLGTKDPGELVTPLQNPARIVSCSFLLPVKRVDRFAPVLVQTRLGGTQVSWTHIGDGDGLADLRATAEHLLGREHVDLRGYVRNADVPALYRDLAPLAFVNLSESEGVPVSIMEAIALGIPVVATAVGGVPEIVHDGENGYLVPRDFADEAAAGALNRLAKMPQAEFRAMGRQSRRLWEERFNEAVVYPAFVDELRRPVLR